MSHKPTDQQMTNWQIVRYGDSDEARAALAYWRERGWPVDNPDVSSSSGLNERMDGFKAGYRAAHAAATARIAELQTAVVEALHSADCRAQERDREREAIKLVEAENQRLKLFAGEIMGLSFGFDEDGSLGPRPPLSWETVARMALDLARGMVYPPPALSSTAGGQ